MDNETSRTIIKQLSKLKNIDRDVMVDILLGYIGSDYDLTRIINDVLDLSDTTKIRGL